MSVRCIVALPALTGAYGRPGGGCLAGTNSGGAFCIGEVTREDFMAKPPRLVNMNRLGHALNELTDPPVMALYVYHSNPAAVTPDQNAVLRGLAREDLFTVVHERFLTDTARWADHRPAGDLLPGAQRSLPRLRHLLHPAGAGGRPAGGGEPRQLGRFRASRRGDGLSASDFFRQSADELIDRLLALPSPLRAGIDEAAFAAGKGVELALPPEAARTFATPSGRIEIYNPREAEPLPRYLPTYEEAGEFPLRLMTAPSLFALNASFYEQDELRQKQGGMRLLLHPAEAAGRGLRDGQAVVAFNRLGEVVFLLGVSEEVPRGVAVAEGVWWIEHAPGERTVNALTSQRLTDRGNGSTFYDNSIEVRGR